MQTSYKKATTDSSLRQPWTIVIATWNRLSYLRCLVNSIRENSEWGHRIRIHVNDGSDGTLDWVRENGIAHTHTDQNVGLPRAANTCALYTSTKWMYLVDDDMYLLRGWDKALVDFYECHPFGKKIWLNSLMIEATDSPHSIKADYGSHPIDFRRMRLHLDQDKFMGRQPILRGNTLPALVSTDFWHEVGGYSQEFSPGIGSEIDLAKKFWDHGCRNFPIVNTSLVYHFGSRTTGCLAEYHKHAENRETQFKRLYGVPVATFREEILQKHKPWEFEVDG